jgi:hypothetical protein
VSRAVEHRTRFALGLAVLVVVAAACRPVAPPPPPLPPAGQWCAAYPPGNSNAYQYDFEALRLSYTEWASADGAIPIDLPDGRTVWMFGDTYVGKVGGDGVIDSNDRIVRNSFVVQSGACFAPLMGGAPFARSELIPNPSPNEWYWPASGVVDGGVLRVFMWHMLSTPGSGLGFATIDMQMATFALPSLSLQSITGLPFPTDSTHPYGATAMAGPGPAGSDVYLYGSNSGNVYAARAPLGQLTVAGAWQFWDGTTWQANSGSSQPMAWTGVSVPSYLTHAGSGPLAQPWVLPYGTGFLATAKSADVFSPDISVFTAPTPAGPWTLFDQVANTTAPNLVAYGAFSRAPDSNPMVVYSINTTFDNPAPPQSIYNYGPKFVTPAAGSLPPVPH